MQTLPRSTDEILEYLATEAAEKLAGRVLLPAFSHAVGEHLDQEEAKARLEDAGQCLSVILGHYAFARRGKEKRQLSQLGLEALYAVQKAPGIDTFLKGNSAGELWNEFENLCIANKRKPMPSLNLGVVAGFAELAQEIYRSNGKSIFGWIGEAVVSGRGLEEAFVRIVDVRGVGPKLTAQLLRDVVWLYDVDRMIPAKDLIYVQPIDRWIRLLSEVVVDEAETSQLADWVLAGKFAKTCRQHQVSSVRVSLGCAWLGIQAHDQPQQDKFFLTSLTHFPAKKLPEDMPRQDHLV